MNELSWLEINLSRLDGNLESWRSILRAGAASRVSRQIPLLCAVVKANAYGLGAVAIARRLSQRGVDMLAVYTSNQAEELIDAQVAAPILVLMPTRELAHTPAIAAAAKDGMLHLAVNDPMQLSMVDAFGRSLHCRIPIHLHLDTGMSRSGLTRGEFDKMLLDLPRFTNVRLAGIWSHLACAGEGESAYEQLARLDEALAANRERIGPDVIVHTGATAAAARDPKFHRDMVRIGFGLYGHGLDLLRQNEPSGSVFPLAPSSFGAPGNGERASRSSSGAGEGQGRFIPTGFQPVLRWVARIIHLQHYPAGALVGYNGTHCLTRDSVLGVVPVGYADGYPWSLSNRSMVQLVSPGGRAATVPVLGAVSMDQIVIDLTDHPEAKAGDRAELISSDPQSPCSLMNVATTAGTSPYELLCRLSPRLARTYISTGPAAPTLTLRRAEQVMAPTAPLSL